MPLSQTFKNSKPELNVVSLVSVGQHPQSGRVRRAEQDARAVELGMKLTSRPIIALHAGNPEEPALKSYAGMGLESLEVLAMSDAADPITPLKDYLREARADIVLTGVRAERGESSGMVPYLLAEQLGWPMVSRIADIIKIEAGEAEVLQALPRGQRRLIKVTLPFIASVDNAAADARQSAYGPASRAQINVQKVNAATDSERESWHLSPAKKRPKRMKVVKAKTAAERFKAATAKPQSESGRVMKAESPAEQAQAIFELLLDEGVLR